MGDEPRRQRRFARPRPGLPPGVGRGARAELRQFGELGLAANQRLGGDVPDLFQVRRLQELPGFGSDDIRQPSSDRDQPEPVHQPVKVRLCQLLVSPVYAPGDEPTGALAGVMFGHHPDDPPVGPDSGPGHALPRREPLVSG